MTAAGLGVRGGGIKLWENELEDDDAKTINLVSPNAKVIGEYGVVIVPSDATLTMKNCTI